LKLVINLNVSQRWYLEVADK